MSSGNFGEILLYRREDGSPDIHVKFEEGSTCRNLRQVRQEWNREVTRELPSEVEKEFLVNIKHAQQRIEGKH